MSDSGKWEQLRKIRPFFTFNNYGNSFLKVTLRAIASDTIDRYRLAPSKGQLPPLLIKLALHRLDNSKRTSDNSPLVQLSPSNPPSPCASSSGKHSDTDTIHWKIANNLSKGNVPGPFKSNSCSAISFFSFDFSELLKDEIISLACKGKWSKIIKDS